jgi:hypothetical protein
VWFKRYLRRTKSSPWTKKTVALANTAFSEDLLGGDVKSEALKHAKLHYRKKI